MALKVILLKYRFSHNTVNTIPSLYFHAIKKKQTFQLLGTNKTVLHSEVQILSRHFLFTHFSELPLKLTNWRANL